jgi:hypothetical protein
VVSSSLFELVTLKDKRLALLEEFPEEEKIAQLTDFIAMSELNAYVGNISMSAPLICICSFELV